MHILERFFTYPSRLPHFPWSAAQSHGTPCSVRTFPAGATSEPSGPDDAGHSRRTGSAGDAGGTGRSLEHFKVLCSSKKSLVL